MYISAIISAKIKSKNQVSNVHVDNINHRLEEVLSEANESKRQFCEGGKTLEEEDF